MAIREHVSKNLNSKEKSWQQKFSGENILWIPNIHPEISKELKTLNKDITFT